MGPQPDLFTAAGAAGKVGFSKAMSAGWITLDKAAKPPLVKRKVSAIEDAVQVHLSAILAGDVSSVGEKEKADYKKRKLVVEVTDKLNHSLPFFGHLPSVAKDSSFTVRLTI